MWLERWVKDNVTQKQIDEIIKRAPTNERVENISKRVGLTPQRVSEIIKFLNIDRKKPMWMRPFEALYNILSTETHRGTRTIPLDMSYEQFVGFTTIKECHYCGSPIVWPERIRKGLNRACTNLDRKDNSLGYSVDNCVVCCGWCNRTKGDRFTYEEFMLVAPILRRIQELKKAKT